MSEEYQRYYEDEGSEALTPMFSRDVYAEALPSESRMVLMVGAACGRSVRDLVYVLVESGKLADNATITVVEPRTEAINSIVHELDENGQINGVNVVVSRGDGADLSSFENDSFDMVVGDFLLNWAGFMKMDDILSESSRVSSDPGKVVMVFKAPSVIEISGLGLPSKNLRIYLGGNEKLRFKTWEKSLVDMRCGRVLGFKDYDFLQVDGDKGIWALVIN